MAESWANTWQAAPAPSASAPYSRTTFGDTWGYTSPFGYEPGKTGGGGYDAPFGSNKGGFTSPSTFTSSMLSHDMSTWLADEAKRLGYEDWGGSTAVGIGNVGVNVNGRPFGRFTADADAEIQAAANAYGVPANFLKAIIAKESSGDWANNSTPVSFGPRGGKRIHGYVGVFEDAAASWGYDFNEGIGNRAYQIDMLAGGLRGFYDSLRSKDPAMGWLNVAAYHYSGDPTGNYTPPDSVEHGTTKYYMDTVKQWWDGLDADAGNATTGQPVSNAGGEWANIDRWNNLVQEASQRYNVPANLIKAVMRTESQGIENAGSPQGATGLMQVMPNMHGLSREQLLDPRTNVLKGAEILRSNYDQWGSWELASKAYLAGNPYSTAVDDHNTGVNEYWAKVSGYFNQLEGGGGGGGGQGGPPEGWEGMSQLDAIWGGIPEARLTQGHGRTDFSAANPGMYDYSYAVLGYLGHPGIDVGMDVGTPIYNALPGEVTRAGGTNSYLNRMGHNPSDSGEVRVQLSNGDEIIYGHLSALNVKVGDIVTPGQVVGLSGYPAGPHLHLEVRVNGKAVDPRDYFSGTFTGWFQSGEGQRLGSSIHPMSYSEMLRAASEGKEIRTEAMGDVPQSFNEFLQVGARGGNYNQVLEGMKVASSSPSYLQDYAKRVYEGSFLRNPYNPSTVAPSTMPTWS